MRGTLTASALGLLLMACGGGGGSKTDTAADTGTVVDADGDGAPAAVDCDDDDPARFPGAEERCNEVDDDCDGEVDEGAGAATWYPDLDGDTFGDGASPVEACDAPPGHVADGTDCDDTRAEAHPGADELCNGADDDCDSFVDDDPVDPSTWYADDDADGFGDAADPGTIGCVGPPGAVDDASDCDDDDPDVHPDGTERCNGVDDDCDDAVDEDDAVDAPEWFPDADEDGFGDGDAGVTACAQPDDAVAEAGDCADDDPAVFPGADEWCDAVDSDCDDDLDDPDALDVTPWFADADGDGFGDPDVVVEACEAPLGHVADAGDCDDADPAIGALRTWYLDDDGDGYGRDAGGEPSCEPLPGRVDVPGDCDDRDPELHPDTVWYEDIDRDGFGDDASATVQCEPPDRDWTRVGGDCDPLDPTVWPDAPERCFDDDGAPEGADNDCDGVIDEECPIPHCGRIALDEVWSPTPWGHEVTCDVEVEGATLTIEDGVTVTFHDRTALRVAHAAPAALVIDGAVDGVRLEPSADEPSPGIWDGVAIGPFDTGSTLTGVTTAWATVGLTLAGADVEVDGWTGSSERDGGVVVDGGAPVLRDVAIADAGGPGLTLDGAAAVVEGFVASRATDAGVQVEDGNNTLSDVYVEDVTRGAAPPVGLDVVAGALTVDGVEVVGGDGGGITLQANVDGAVFALSDVAVRDTPGTGLLALDFPYEDTVVTVDGGTISGALWNGVNTWCSGAAAVTLRDLEVTGTDGDGVYVELGETGSLVLDRVDASGNDEDGVHLILYTDDGTATVTDVVTNDNAQFGFVLSTVFSTLDLTVDGLTADRNGSDGISIGGAGAELHARFDAAYARDNGGDGWLLDNGEDGTTALADIAASGNDEVGLRVVADGFVEVVGADVSGNGEEGVRLDDGELALVDATLVGNGTSGVYSAITVDTHATLTGFAGNTVTGSSAHPYDGDDFDSLGVLGDDTYDSVFYGRSDLTGNAIDVVRVTHSGTGRDLVVRDPGVPIHLLDGLYSYGRGVEFVGTTVYVVADKYVLVDDGFFGEGVLSATDAYFGPLDPGGGWLGLYAGTGVSGRIEGCVIEGSSGDDVRIRDTRVEVVGNTIQDAAEYGVNCEGGCDAGYTVTGNVFARNGLGDTN